MIIFQQEVPNLMQETNNQPPAAPGGKPTSRKKILMWILLICGIILLLIALIVGGATYYAYTKMKDMGLTPGMLGDDPGTAFGKIVEATNDDIEFVSSDKEKGVVTFRNKTTGETVTVDIDSIKAGEFPEVLMPGPDVIPEEEDSGEEATPETQDSPGQE